MEAVWRWLALCVCAGSAGNDACDLQADRCSEGSGASEATALLQLASTLEACQGCKSMQEYVGMQNVQRRTYAERRSSFNESYWYPVRGLDAGRSGWSQRASGPFPLSAPSWSFEIPGLNFHQTALLPCLPLPPVPKKHKFLLPTRYGFLAFRLVCWIRKRSLAAKVHYHSRIA